MCQPRHPDDLPDDDAHARASDPATSHAAAGQQDQADMLLLRANILLRLQQAGPHTDPQLVDWVRGPDGPRKHNGGLFAAASVRGRRKDLCRSGHVRQAGGQDRFNIWQATPDGEVAATALEVALRTLQYDVPDTLRALVTREQDATTTATQLLSQGVQPWVNPYQPPVQAVVQPIAIVNP